MLALYFARGTSLSLQVEPVQTSKRVMFGPEKYHRPRTQSVHVCPSWLPLLLFSGVSSPSFWPFFPAAHDLTMPRKVAQVRPVANQHKAIKQLAFFFCFFSFFLSFFFFLSLDDEELEDESFPSAFLSHNRF